MVVDLPRRWRWIVAAACALIAAVAVWFVTASRAAERQAQAAAAVASATAHAAGSSSGLPAFAAPAASARTEPGIDEIEVCGIGWTPVSADGTPDEALLDAHVTPARDRILAAMRIDSSELVRASAMLLDGSTLDALASAAVSSTDPGTYGLAFQRCNGRAEGACELLSAERWAQLDPDNAQPWLHVFDAARSRGDVDGEREALYRIASSKRSATGFFSPAASVLGAATDDDLAQLAALDLIVEATGKQAANVVGGYQDILAACRGEAVKDANRLQVCGSIAELFTQHSDSMLEFILGVSLGRQVGWPADRADQLTGERALYAATLGEVSPPSADLGCRGVRRHLDLVRQYLVGGEVTAMRDWAEKSGRTPEDFVHASRERSSTR